MLCLNVYNLRFDRAVGGSGDEAEEVEYPGNQEEACNSIKNFISSNPDIFTTQ